MRTLEAFWLMQPEAKGPLKDWYKKVDDAQWTNFSDLKADFPSADLVRGTDRVVFNVGGNKYRVIAVVDYLKHGVLIRFVGTHAEYDRIKAETI
jgi:mRNA interferase HigB